MATGTTQLRHAKHHAPKGHPTMTHPTMIDHQEKTMQLITAMEDTPGLTARLSPELKGLIRKKDPTVVVPNTCSIAKIIYAGEEGGITCELEFGHDKEKAAFWASLTHLIFDRRCPLYRQIAGYQKHRIKKLKKQSGDRY